MANIFVQWLMSGLMPLLHPFFVSVIEINHNPKEQSVEISVRIFTNDFEKTLQKYTTAKLDLLKPADNAATEKLISRYIADHLKLKVNGQTVTPNYLGHEIQQESVWSYFEVPKVASVKTLQVDCNLLYDFETAQSNIFHVKTKDNDKSYKLDYPKTSTIFQF